MAEPPRRFGVIGYALAPKKRQSFIQPSLVELSRARGVDLVLIDLNKPLADQGRFDCILHKVSGEDWKAQLREYSEKHPGIPIIDPPDAVERLHNRISMLQVVSDIRIPPRGQETFGVPRQVVIYDQAALADPDSFLGALHLPVIAKPLVADGSAKSHNMALVCHRDGLLELKPPLVLQEFVNHGGVVFKVYVVGDYVTCVKRKSLPDVPEEKLESLEGAVPFSQVSNLAADEEWEENKYYDTMHLEVTEMPPASFVTDIARGLRDAMGLRLFNFDVIRDMKVGNHYLVIDINYFPGYAKMPSYETILTDFFCDVVFKKSPDPLLGLGAKVDDVVEKETLDDPLGDDGCSDRKMMSYNNHWNATKEWNNPG